MKESQKVNYYRPEEGLRVDAEVVAITGAGENNNKILTLRYREDGKDVVVENVYHYDDGSAGEPFWLLKGDRVLKGWNEETIEEEEVKAEPKKGKK